MHRTGTVDFAIVLEGEIDMLLDEQNVHLKAGDVVIQRGTNHNWTNRYDKICRIAFVLIDSVDEHGQKRPRPSGEWLWHEGVLDVRTRYAARWRDRTARCATD